MFRESFLFLLLGLGTVVSAVEKYSSRYDYVDVDLILQNTRQREAYYECFLGRSRCQTADAMFFKDIFAEALTSNCKRCTAKQTENLNKITDWYTRNEPEKFNVIVANAIKKARSKT